MANVLINDRLRMSITDDCNFSCKYCTNEGQRHGEKHYIGLDFIQNLVECLALENIYIKKINITGGEPLLHSALADILKEFSNLTSYITLNTNGSLLNEDIIDQLVCSGLTNIKFGIDSIRQTTKPGLADNDAKKLDTILRNIIYSKALMPRTSMNIVLSSFNQDEICAIIEFILRNHINYTDFIELIQHDFWENGKVPSKGLSFDVLVKVLTEFDNNLKIKYDNRLGKYLLIFSNGFVMQYALDFCNLKICNNLWTRINARGQILPCIKKDIAYDIDFSKPLTEQFKTAHRDICPLPEIQRLPDDIELGSGYIEKCDYEHIDSYYDVGVSKSL